MADWQVNRGRRACNSCEKRFAPKESYHSALVEEKESFVRADFCLECWPKQDTAGFFSFWQTILPEKEEQKKIQIDAEAIYAFFNQLENAESRNQQVFRYILALLLARKRFLRFDRLDQIKPEQPQVEHVEADKAEDVSIVAEQAEAAAAPECETPIAEAEAAAVEQAEGQGDSPLAEAVQATDQETISADNSEAIAPEALVAEGDNQPQAGEGQQSEPQGEAEAQPETQTPVEVQGELDFEAGPAGHGEQAILPLAIEQLVLYDRRRQAELIVPIPMVTPEALDSAKRELSNIFDIPFDEEPAPAKGKVKSGAKAAKA